MNFSTNKRSKSPYHNLALLFSPGKHQISRQLSFFFKRFLEYLRCFYEIPNLSKLEGFYCFKGLLFTLTIITLKERFSAHRTLKSVFILSRAKSHIVQHSTFSTNGSVEEGKSQINLLCASKVKEEALNKKQNE